MTLTRRATGDSTRDVTLKRAKVDVPVVQSRDASARTARRSARCASPASPSGAHGEVEQRGRTSCSTRARKGIVLDLRDNGGGLLNEAVPIASVFIPDGHDRLHQGPRAARARLQRRRAARSSRRSRSPCSSTRARRRRRRSSPARCRTASAPRSSGTRTFGKGVFQEIEQLSNGGALDITVGEYFTPSGRNLGGGGVKQGAGITPDVKAQDDPKTPSATRRSTRRCETRAPASVSARRPVVGRAREARPLPARRRRSSRAGSRINVDKPRREARAGDLVLVAPTGARGGPRQGRAPDRAPGRRARRARGADARPRAAAALRPAGRARGARGAERRAGDGPRRDLRELPTFTIDPPTARDFDDAISRRAARRRRDPRVGAHRRRRRARAARLGASTARRSGARTRVYVPGAGRADAARGAVQPRVLARARTRTGSRSPSSSTSRARRCARTRVPPLADPLRRAARLPAGRPRSSPARERAEEPWAAPLAAARAVAARAGRGARGARRARGRVRRAGVRASRARAT